MKCRSFVFLILSLMSFGSLEAAETGGHGLLPLKEHEKSHLENRVEKVIRIKPNSLGAERIRRHLKDHQLPGSDAVSSEGEEFSTKKISTAEALQSLAADTPLPSSVNNSLLPSFPPIGDQGQIGSCVAWGSTYYQATHEIGLLNGTNNKIGSNWILSPKWTYDILNNGVDDGLSVTQAFQLLSSNGAASIVNFPYDANYTAWDLLPQDWISAINNRLGNYTLIPGLGGSGTQNLTAIKSALVNGHVLTFATFIDSWVFTQIKHDPQNIDNSHVGEYAAVYMKGENGGHFMTIVGYDDNLWIDVNNNGSVDAGERGAFLVANSWGSSWGNNGFIWISYDAFLASSKVAGAPHRGRVPAGIYLNNSLVSVVPKAKNYSPSLVAQFSLSQAVRNQISINAGVSTVTQNSPTTTLSDYALSNQGGALEFNGTNPSTPEMVTFALDFTDLLPTGSQPAAQRYYLTVGDSASGNPTVLNSFTLLDLVHMNQISASNLPMAYDSSTGKVYLDYDFADGISPAPAVVPAVAFASPMSSDTLAGTVQVSVNASDILGISNVQLYLDSTLIGAMTSSMGSYVASIDTTKFGNGSHQLKAVATDTSNNSSQALETIQIANPVSLPSIYINAGGPTLTAQGVTWLADTGYVSGGSTYRTTQVFPNRVYKTDRFGNMTYQFNVPNGNYSVTLKFAEISLKRKNARLFNVAINGSSVINNLDLVAIAGANVPYDLTFPVAVTNGAISIVFTSVVNNAVINAIQIVPQH